uniref:Uncharacterized protein n=1 Tax=Cucumis melo TaxID=3656 RepID=A0A9I9CU36_CUCME
MAQLSRKAGAISRLVKPNSVCQKGNESSQRKASPKRSLQREVIGQPRRRRKCDLHTYHKEHYLATKKGKKDFRGSPWVGLKMIKRKKERKRSLILLHILARREVLW